MTSRPLWLALAPLLLLPAPHSAQAVDPVPLAAPVDPGLIKPRPKPGPFKADQLRYARVREAEALSREALTREFAAVGLSYPPAQILLRNLKYERALEMWARAAGASTYVKVKTFEVCQLSGEEGPKRAQGDGQVPEGFYALDRFNPASSFLLSLGVDYPNQADRILGEAGNLGGDIFIHGGCATIGCVPIGDAGIRALYLAAVDARDGGQRSIPFMSFPRALTDEAMAELRSRHSGEDTLLATWQNLKQGWDLFEQTHLPPAVKVAADGSYLFEPGR